MPSIAAAIQAIARELAEIMIPSGAVVLDPEALGAALMEWYARRDRLAEDDDWCWGWPDQLSLRDAVLDLLLVYEDELTFRRHLDRAAAAEDQRDVETWEHGLAECTDLRHALAERIATLIRV